MSLISIFFIAVGLALDAFAVSIASGITIKNMKIRHAFVIAGFFSFFQAIMPLAGWCTGLKIKGFIEKYDHWVVFAILSIIGIKMIYEAFQLEETEKNKNPLQISVLFILAIATSIDALAVGFSISVLNGTIVLPAIIIGSVTFLMSFMGVYIGNCCGNLFEKNIEIAGGLVLIGIGVKVLIGNY
ncbi:MAG: manganese efflux pump [Fibrobacter sp.]|nr:manganese efflux pump [Fibrobacter sp.]